MTTRHLVHMGHVVGQAQARGRAKRSTRKSAVAGEHGDILIEELNAVHGELSRVDNKASMLLGFAAGGLLLTTVGQPVGLGGILIKASMGLAAASIIPLLIAVRPRLGTTGFPHHAHRTVAQLRGELSKVDPRTWRSEQLIALSRIAVRKFKLLRMAAGLQAIALVVASAGALLLAI